MSTGEVEGSITKAIAYLQGVQRPNGSFTTLISPGVSFDTHTEVCTTFTAALILGRLAGINKAAGSVRTKLVGWLLQQQSPQGSFNYWPVGAKERVTRPYPDDLDDTFCALSALYAHDPSLIDSARLAASVTLLVAAEKNVGGPYRTWLVGRPATRAWHDVDVAVNATVAQFLAQVATPPPRLIAFLERAIAQNALRSSYYDSRLVIAYYLSRVPLGSAARQSLQQIILAQRQGEGWATPLQAALAISALRAVGETAHVAQAVLFLLATQQPDGSWPPEPVWIDEIRGDSTYHAGSPALTTAFVLEALAGGKSKPQRAGLAKSARPSAARQILRHMRQEHALLPPALRRESLAMLKCIEASSASEEIMLLPHKTAQSLRQGRVSPETILQLSLANTYGWMAYTIYDDFLDDEGQPRLLPAANFALRQSLNHFRQALPDHPSFQQMVDSFFNQIDAANTREVIRCRQVVKEGLLQFEGLAPFPILSLAERSIGHALPSLGVLAAAGINLAGVPAQCVQKALRHYLAARQLNDDLHDWKEDLEKGHITFVVHTLLEGAAIKPGAHPLADLKKQLEQYFWREALPALCAKAQAYAARSSKLFAASGLLYESHGFISLLQHINDCMERTLQDHRAATAFLAAYKNPNPTP